MGRFVENLIGRKFSRLMVLSRAPNNRRGNTRWNCRCDCGVETTVIGSALRGNWIGSCGCASVDTRTVHGHGRRDNRSSEYNIWRGMVARCRNPKYKKYRYWGGRGISVCDRWLSFENFYADMGPRPSPEHSIDREDNDGNYEPSNCRWATRAEQARNTSKNRLFEYDGRRISMAEAAEMAGLSYQLLRGRLDNGWSLQRAMSTPRRPGRMDCLMPVQYL